MLNSPVVHALVLSGHGKKLQREIGAWNSWGGDGVADAGSTAEQARI
jgi:hypothetical protein